MLGDFLMEELYSFVREGWEQEDDITLVTLRRTTAASRLTSKNTYLPGPWANKRRGTRRGHRNGPSCGKDVSARAKVPWH
jgi:hypothetical protein